MKAIVCGKLFDSVKGSMQRDRILFVEDHLIAGNESYSQSKIPSDVEIIDFNDSTVIPGLIDCHDHLASFGYDIAGRWGLVESQSQRYMRIASVLRLTLETGYTTVRDAGGLPAGIRDAITENLIPGPRMLVSINIISPTGGIGEHLSSSGHQSPLLGDPAMPSGVANGAIEMRTKVREMVRSGADVIKFASTGGASSRSGLEPTDMLITRSEIDALVEESHNLGKKVMCHALGGPGLTESIEAGVNSIEHGTFLHKFPASLDLMAKNSIFFTPTFSVYRHHAEKGTPHGKRRAQEMALDHKKSLMAAINSGVKVAAGTDAGGWLHGNNAEELTALVEAGMTPSQALQSGTITAAECIGLDGELGSLSPGKIADLVVLNKDPLQSIESLEFGKSVSLVMKSGLII